MYGKGKRNKLGARIVNKQDHFLEICKAIKAQTSNNRPVIVFLSTIDMVIDFYQSPEFAELKGNSTTLTEKNDQDAT